MSRLQEVETKYADSPSVDAFGRYRVSEPVNLFDSKQIFDNAPLCWDEELESGSGITSAHSTATASTVFTSTLNTAGVFTRQTFMRFNYQPGKSQSILMTGILKRSGGGVGVERRIGYFDDDNGLFFEDNAGVIGVTRRTSVTGSPVDSTVVQADWNIDKLDGTGPSGVIVDWSKTQIFMIDFQWLGTGRIRMSLFLGGRIQVVHEVTVANVLDKVFMSKPNLPLRYQMVTTGSSPVATLEAICTTVFSEGGSQDLGVIRYKSTAGTHVDCNSENTIYAIIGIRLKAANLAATIKLLNADISEHQGSKFFEWILLFNPTVADTFTYSDETNSSVQTATGATANTVTGGTAIGGGQGSSAQKGGTTEEKDIDNAIKLGAKIDGTVDEIVLCVRPIGGTGGLDIEASLSWREIN